MGIKSFSGGVHPHDFKELARFRATETISAGKIVVIPLLQHIGAPAEALVKKGDRVLRGQKIAEAKGMISAPVYSSVSGNVKSVEPYPSPAGNDILSVIIENDQQNETVAFNPLKSDLSAYSPDEIRNAVKEAGIVGLGGAAFPTVVKITPPRDASIDTLILNGAECEPYLTTDYRLMLEKSSELIEAADVLKNCLGAKKVYLGVETNKEDVIALYSEKLAGRSDFEVVALKTKYPQGGEKMLIKAILKRDVPAGGLPFHVGVVVQNVGTVYAIYEALKFGKPLIERGVTVTGDGIAEPKNLWVPIGTLFTDVIAACGGKKGDPQKLIMGGPMMGIAQWREDVPVVKATSGILLLSETDDKKEYPCIRCGRCVEHCPMFIVPTRVVSFLKIKDFQAAENWRVLDCMECGTCQYLCPAGIPLVQWIRWGKFELLSKKRAEAKK